jgi:hypothetical protein
VKKSRLTRSTGFATGRFVDAAAAWQLWEVLIDEGRMRQAEHRLASCAL